jgi:hypothetical protein
VSAHVRHVWLRAFIVAAAVVAAAWCALGARQAADTSQAAAIAGSSATLSPAQARRADSLLRGAAFLNPDGEVQLLQAQVALESGDKLRARQLAEDVTRSEPMNVAAWVVLARSSNRAGFFRALQHVAELVPSLRQNH